MMSDLPPLPKSGNPLALSQKVAAAYLNNVTLAMQSQIRPHTSEEGRSSLDECIRTLQRTALHLSQDILENNDVESEIHALYDLEQKAKKLLTSTPEVSDDNTRGVSPEQLQAYLRSQTVGGPELKVIEAKTLNGGRSKQTVLIRLANAISLPEEVVMRQDWHSSITGTTVKGEFDILRKVFSAGVAVPEPLLLETDPVKLGGAFILFRRIKGTALGDPFTSPDSSELVLDLARQLAQIHAIDIIDLCDLPRNHYGADTLTTNLQTWRGIISQLGEPSKVVNAALDWLESRVNILQSPLGLVHGDLGFHNLLCQDNYVAGVLDWELAHYGCPALDLGYLRSVVSQRVPWNSFLEAYRGAGGIEFEDSTIDFYTLYASIWLYQLLLQARAGVAFGMVNDMEVTGVCAHFIPALINRIAQEYLAISGLSSK